MPEQTDFLDEEFRRRVDRLEDVFVMLTHAVIATARELVQLQGLVEDRRASSDPASPISTTRLQGD